MKKWIELFKETIQDWSEDKAPRLAAALAYYTTFSLAPLLVIAIAVAGLFLDRQAVQNEIMAEVGGLMGEEGAEIISGLIENSSQPATNVLAAVVGVATLLFGASGVFGQLQEALNTIWEVAPKPGQGIWAMVRKRFFSFSLVVGTGFLLLVSLVISAGLAALNKYFTQLLPGAEPLWMIANTLISVGVTTLIFMLMFKVLPDAEIQWRDVGIGAFFTAVLFEIGKFLIGLYLGNSGVASTYGAAGSLVVLLLWIYYSSQILFLGAEFTQVYARRYGSRIVPDEDAIPLTEEMREQQGVPHAERLQQRVEEQESTPYSNAGHQNAAHKNAGHNNMEMSLERGRESMVSKRVDIPTRRGKGGLAFALLFGVAAWVFGSFWSRFRKY